MTRSIDPPFNWPLRLSILADAVVFGSDARPSHEERKASRGWDECRRRLLAELSAARAESDAANAFVKLRDKEAPDWNHPLLAVTESELAAVKPENPWIGRRGWERQQGLPIIKTKAEDGGEKPVEPAYELFNELVIWRYFRPFRTRSGEPRCAVPTRHGLAIWDPRGERFPAWIGHEYYALQGKRAPFRTIQTAVREIQQTALDEGLARERIVELSIRVTKAENGDPLLDLADSRHRCVRIGKDGWTIETTGYPVFDTPSHLGELPEPVRPAERMALAALDELWQFLRLPREGPEGDQRLLATTQLVQFLIAPGSTHGVSVILGGEGDGKSATAERFQEVVDPSSVPSVHAPKDEDKLADLAYNRATLNFDNVSVIPRWLSDLICALSTGTALSKRELYSNRGEVNVRRHYWFILNGITASPQFADLLRRSVFYTVQPPTTPIDKDELAAEFRGAHPRILGALLEVAVATRGILEGPGQPDPDKDSMAGLVKVGRAVARALGRRPSDFDLAWHANRERRESAAADNPWVDALIAEFGPMPVGARITPQELANRIAENHRAAFPKGVTPESVGNEILRAGKALARVGIRVQRGRTSGRRFFSREGPESTGTPALLERFSLETGGVPVPVPVACRSEATGTDPSAGHGETGTEASGTGTSESPSRIPPTRAGVPVVPAVSESSEMVMEEAGNWTGPPRDRARPRGTEGAPAP